MFWFFDRRRVISDKLFDFVPMGLYEIEGWSSSVGVVNGSKWESDLDGEVESRPGRVRHLHMRAK